MGSGADAVHETVDYLTARGEKVGVVKIHLYRPFSRKHLLEALPSTVKVISVLDRCKEPGSYAEPLHLDVVTALSEAGGRGCVIFIHASRSWRTLWFVLQRVQPCHDQGGV